MTVKPVLLADVGGTNVRLALAEPGKCPQSWESWLTALYPGLASAITEFLALNGSPALSGMAVAGAGPVTQGEIRMTNLDWVIRAPELAAAAGLAAGQVRIVNDFAAVAWSLLMLDQGSCQPVGAALPGVPGGPMVVLGPGTGFGVAAMVPDGKGNYVPVASEGGNADLAPLDDRDLQILFQLQRKFGHVKIERVLSGPGLETLAEAIAAIDGVALADLPRAADITQRALAGTCPVCAEAVERFILWLGSVAGNLALTFAATGGVFIAGGIVPRLGAHFDAGQFRRRFEAKGSFKGWLSAIPVRLITHPEPALLGLSRLMAETGG